MGLLGEISTRVFALLNVVLLARLLGANELGNYNYALAQASFFVVFFDFGILPIAVREITQNRNGSTFLLFGVIKVLGISVGLLGASLFAFMTTIATQDRILIIGLCIVLALSDLSTYIFSIYRATNEFWRETMWKTIFSFTKLCACFTVLLFSPSINLVILSLVASSLLCLWPLSREVYKEIKKRKFIVSKSKVYQAIKECAPVAGTVLIGTVYMNADVAILGRYIQKDHLANYVIAIKIIFGIVTMPVFYFTLSILPSLSSMIKKDSMEQVRTFWLSKFIKSTTSGAIIILLIANFSEQIITFLFGVDYNSAATIIKIYCLVGLFHYLFIPLSQLLFVTGKQRYTFFIQLLATLINLTLLLSYVPQYGIHAALSIAIGTHFFITVAHIICVLKLREFSWKTEEFIPFFRIVIGFFGAIYILNILKESSHLISMFSSLMFFGLIVHKEIIMVSRILFEELINRRVNDIG